MSINFTNVEKLIVDLLRQEKIAEAHAAFIRLGNELASETDPQVHYRLGKLAHLAGLPSAAKQCFNLAVSLAPSDDQSHYQLGLVYLTEGKYAEAVAAFQRATQLKAKFALAHLHWGVALSRQGQLKEAIDQFDLASNMEPTLVSAFYQLGLSKAMLGDAAGAQIALQKAIRGQSNFVEAYNVLGIICAANNDFKQAVKYFLQSVSLVPSNAKALSNLAFCLACLNEHEQALPYFSQALDVGDRKLVARDRALIYNNWGVSLYYLRRIEVAIEKFVEAKEIDPNNLKASINLGLSNLVLKEYELACQIFEGIIASHPDSAILNLYLAVAYLCFGKYDGALKTLNEGQTKGLTEGQSAIWLAYSNLGLGKNEEAKRYFTRACQDEPDNYLAWDGLAGCLALLGDCQQAVQTLQHALKINDKFALGYLHLSHGLKAIGDKKNAKLAYEQACALDKNCARNESEMIQIFLDAAKPQLAFAQAAKVLDFAPEDVDARLALAGVLLRQNLINDALAVCQSVLEVQPSNTAALTLLGKIRFSQGDLLDSDACFRLAAQSGDDQDASLYLCWGKTLSLLRLPELAVDKYAIASEIDPYDADIYENWGKTLRAMGRLEEAAEVFKRAVQLI